MQQITFLKIFYAPHRRLREFELFSLAKTILAFIHYIFLICYEKYRVQPVNTYNPNSCQVSSIFL